MWTGISRWSSGPGTGSKELLITPSGLEHFTASKTSLMLWRYHLPTTIFRGAMKGKYIVACPLPVESSSCLALQGHMRQNPCFANLAMSQLKPSGGGYIT